MDNFDDFLEYLYVTGQLDNNNQKPKQEQDSNTQDKPKTKTKNDKGTSFKYGNNK